MKYILFKLFYLLLEYLLYSSSYSHAYFSDGERVGTMQCMRCLPVIIILAYVRCRQFKSVFEMEP